MFTGIIEGLGTIAAMGSTARGRRLEIRSDFSLDGCRVGDSIAVNGACLTAVSVAQRRFAADVSPETLAATAFKQMGAGQRVNLERALRLSDRLDGHLVSGHVDGVGTVKALKPAGNAIVITVDVPPDLTRYMIRKGSVAVDGISLTINQCDRQSFQVSIIPHTAKATTIGTWRPGQPVNIETDLIGKYVERFVTAAAPAPPARDREGSPYQDLLTRAGFL